jgi:hypothetical protein
MLSAFAVILRLMRRSIRKRNKMLNMMRRRRRR